MIRPTCTLAGQWSEGRVNGNVPKLLFLPPPPPPSSSPVNTWWHSRLRCLSPTRCLCLLNGCKFKILALTSLNCKIQFRNLRDLHFQSRTDGPGSGTHQIRTNPTFQVLFISMGDLLYAHTSPRILTPIILCPWQYCPVESPTHPCYGNQLLLKKDPNNILNSKSLSI